MNVAALADRLIDAARTRTATTPFAADEGLDVDAAYEVQDAVLSRLGGTVAVAKLGLTSAAKQRQMNVAEPLYGWLTAEMKLPADHAVDIGRFIQPRVEPEIAFRTNRDLDGPAVTAAAVLAATEWVAPAIDVLDFLLLPALLLLGRRKQETAPVTPGELPAPAAASGH